MSIVDSPQDYAELREDFRKLRTPFLLRTCDATPEDYEALTDEDLKCEYIDGDLIVHSPASFDHEDLVGFILSLLREYVTEKGIGRALGSNVVMQLGVRRFSPDVSVLLNEHADRVHSVRKRVVGPMDLVVEVLSSSTREYDRQTKLPAYRDGGVLECWHIDAERKQFEAHVLREGAYVPTVLATGRWQSIALPGFSVDVEWFWANPLPSVAGCRVQA